MAPSRVCVLNYINPPQTIVTHVYCHPILRNIAVRGKFNRITSANTYTHFSPYNTDDPHATQHPRHTRVTLQTAGRNHAFNKRLTALYYFAFLLRLGANECDREPRCDCVLLAVLVTLLFEPDAVPDEERDRVGVSLGVRVPLAVALRLDALGVTLAVLIMREWEGVRLCVALAVVLPVRVRVAAGVGDGDHEGEGVDDALPDALSLDDALALVLRVLECVPLADGVTECETLTLPVEVSVPLAEGEDEPLLDAEGVGVLVADAELVRVPLQLTDLVSEAEADADGVADHDRDTVPDPLGEPEADDVAVLESDGDALCVAPAVPVSLDEIDAVAEVDPLEEGVPLLLHVPLADTVAVVG